MAGHRTSASKEWLGLFDQLIDSLEKDLSYVNVAYNCSFLWPLLAELVFQERMAFGKIDDPVDKAIQFMRDNSEVQISLTELARVADLSVSRFSVVFKKKTGTSPNEYVLEMKMHKACNLLITTRMTVREIAQMLGFDDPYYFSRCFKKRMGDSPQIFRDKSAY
ncbi:MAG: AraC family transcriptional regulator [Lentisphaerales bacterium]|nr:AraC family transcriptional regulator [Lentisphaerales bacterium]